MATHPPLRVVIVEDTLLLQQRLGESLAETSGCSVVGYAASPAEAIAVIGAQRPDLVTIDLWLAGGTGFEVMKWLQARPAAERPEYVVFTSNRDSTHTAAALRLGAAAVFDKASDVRALLDFVAKASDHHNRTVPARGASNEQPARPGTTPPSDG
jgi:DNA-binding NarL/FixJ family response regulator